MVELIEPKTKEIRSFLFEVLEGWFPIEMFLLATTQQNYEADLEPVFWTVFGTCCGWTSSQELPPKGIGMKSVRRR